MIATSTAMVFLSVVMTLALGGASGVIYALNSRVFGYVSRRIIKWLKGGKVICILFAIIRQIYDFLFVIFIGLFMLMILYGTCDGVVEIYSLVAIFLGFAFGKSIISVFF